MKILSEAKSFKILISTTLVLFVIAWISGNQSRNEIDTNLLTKRFQKDFQLEQRKALTLLNEVFSNFSINGEALLTNDTWIKENHELYDSDGNIVVISRADSLILLSNNALPGNHNNLPEINHGLERLQNGWYFIQSRKTNDITIWVFSLVKKDFRYKNRFLINDFNKHYNIPSSIDISLNSAIGSMIYDLNDDYAFSLIFPETGILKPSAKYYFPLSVFMLILGLTSLLLLIILLCNHLYAFEYKYTSVLLLMAVFVFGRLLMQVFQVPDIFYSSSLFSAGWYGTSQLLPSLGDFFINVILVNVFLFFIFFKIRNSHNYTNINRVIKYILFLTFIIGFFFYAQLILQLLEGLVINSNLNLNIYFIFDFDFYSLIGFLIISCLFFSYYIFGRILQWIVNSLDLANNEKFTLFAITLVSLALLHYYFIGQYTLIWLLIVFSSLVFTLPKEGKDLPYRLSLSNLSITFFLFAIISTYALFVFNKKKEYSKRENVALRISSEHDPIAEFLFHEFEDDLYSDFHLKEIVLMSPYDEGNILSYLKREYFNEFWSKYDIQVTTCAPGEVLIFKPFDVKMVCDEYFREYIENFGKPTLSERFVYLDNNTGRNSYISVIPVFNDPDSSILYNIYLEFEAKFIPKELGFPELLVDEQIDITRNLGDYSYSIYKENKLTNKFGSFLYSVSASVYKESEDIFHFFEKDGYSHLLYNRDQNTIVIVSKPRSTILEKIAPFSYLFVLFLIIVLIVWLSINMAREGFSFSLNFKKRLQFSMIMIVLISVIAIGSASISFIFNIYKNKNETFINEKAHSILIEMENQLAEENILDHSYSQYLRELLVTLSNVFFTDINIFDPKGSLLASSRPRVFDEGLISPIINPIAFNQLEVRSKSLFVHKERIGNLEYISAYVPLQNINNELIAYINLPYFAQQSELRNEISYFMVAFINIYLLLLLLTIVLAFFISNYVTRPLQIIRDSLSKVSFGKTNKKIKWTKNDEIGQLVSEYNRMIDELEVSAELLAQSERESAWREMAKQVAHEIKNPLTPMRLSVQYLQRAWKDKAEDWDERIEKFTKTMVEQIDTLSIIATEFSDFAKMPTQKNEDIDLNKFIPEVLDLYKDFDNLKIEFEPCNKVSVPLIHCDRKQLLRVFNNLIKNAIQSYDKNCEARIIIRCTIEDTFYRIKIQDFGSGIPDHLKGNIFQPYFTTKTAGMGLGLAMVKSIIQSFNGSISFKSEEGSGTSFIIRIPEISKSEIL